MKVRRALAAAVFISTLVPIAGQVYGDGSNGWLMLDFRAYYCAALAQRHGEDPYFERSLHPCESAISRPFYHAPANVTVPAPYPAYALVLFYPLTLLPFGSAAVIWCLLLSIALVVASYELMRVTAQPLLTAWSVLALSLGLVSFSSGNVMPLCVAALVVAARCAQQGFAPFTVIALLVAMIEPQVALPAAIAFAVRYPATRVLLACGMAFLAVVSLGSGGWAQSVAYFASVLPAHALSEVSRDNQYSLSTVLAALGIPQAKAAVAGSISYVCAVVAGVAVGIRLARQNHDPALSILAPPAFALLGGAFVHGAEIAAAVPACLLLLAPAQVYRGYLLAALILLAVPWMLSTSIALLAAPVVVAYLAYALGGRQRTVALAAGTGALAFVVAAFALAGAQSPPTAVEHAAWPPIDARLAEASWRSFVLGNSTNRPLTWLLRLPTWTGLVTYALAASLALGRTKSASKPLRRLPPAGNATA